MEYRVLPHGGEKISVIGLGSGSITGTEQEMTAVIDAAIESGVNYFDLAPSEQAPFYAYAKAFSGRREKIITQMHFGAVYSGGKYGWTRDLEVSDRASLYRDCEKMGVGISVMKPFAGGQLLDAKTSLFQRALTHTQCLQYVLDRPAVMTVLPGVCNMEDLQMILKLPVHADACVRCGHCEARCPFHVKQEDRMEKISQYFSAG